MSLPTTFQGEAVRHTVFVLNRLPTRSLTRITPYEAWIEQKPDSAHLRIFGCVGHMKVPSHFTLKLDDRGVRIVKLGKELGIKAYRLYNSQERRIHMSRDVAFERNKAWPWEESQIGEDEQMSCFIVGDAIIDDVEGGKENQGAEN